MGVNEDYPNVVSGRISDRAKHYMDKYKFTVRDAVELYILYRVNPSKFIELKKSTLEKEILDLKLDLVAKEMELESLENGVD